LNRSVASYMSGDNSSRSQQDPFLRPNVGDRPPTPPSPLKRNPPRNHSQDAHSQDAERRGYDQDEESYHGLPMSPNLEYDRNAAPELTRHSAGAVGESGVEAFTSNFHDDYDQDFQQDGNFHGDYDQSFHQNGDRFLNGDVNSGTVNSLPQIDEDNSVHHDCGRSGSPFDQKEATATGIPYGDGLDGDKLLKERRRDRKLIRFLAAGLVCALMALAAVLGGVVASAVLRDDTPTVPVTIPVGPTLAPSPASVPLQPISNAPTRQPARLPITLAPQSGPPTRSPTKSPLTTTPSKSPSRANIDFGAPPSPTSPPTGISSGFGVAKIP
jgi:hypothetical protein